MAKIERSEVIQAIISALRLDSALEQIPDEIEQKIRGVINVAPKPEIQIAEQVVSDGTTGNIATTHATKRTFLTSLHIAVAKDIVATSILTNISLTPKGGTAIVLLSIRYEPTTAGQFTENIVFPFPIRLEEGTAITITNSAAVASIDSIGIATFFEEEP